MGYGHITDIGGILFWPGNLEKGSRTMKVIIVGGVAGGASAAARLRRLDENAQIIILERGQHISYANCGLPYYVGGVITEESNLTLQTPQSFYERFRIDVRTNTEAVEIHTEDKKLQYVIIIQAKNIRRLTIS